VVGEDEGQVPPAQLLEVRARCAHHHAGAHLEGARSHRLDLALDLDHAQTTSRLALAAVTFDALTAAINGLGRPCVTSRRQVTMEAQMGDIDSRFEGPGKKTAPRRQFHRPPVNRHRKKLCFVHLKTLNSQLLTLNS